MTDSRSQTGPTAPRLRVGSPVNRVDEACDRYEAGWVAGPRPMIEQFLDQVAAIERPSLLHELLAIELEIRRGRGKRPQLRNTLPGSLTMPRWSTTCSPRPGPPRWPCSSATCRRSCGRVCSMAETRASEEIAGYQIQSASWGVAGWGSCLRRQVALGRTVALKMIRAAHLASEAERQRFRIEAEAAAALDHPNIVPIYEVGESAGRLYYTMKLVEGGCLAQWLEQNVPKPRDAALVVAKAARAVGAAHRQGILHRDLKPANILIDRDGKPHITDFGLAKRIGVDCGLTESGPLVGTPSYMSPEQAAGGAGLTTASDVYSLGAILYRLLTGRPPFRGDSVMQTLHRRARACPRSTSIPRSHASTRPGDNLSEVFGKTAREEIPIGRLAGRRSGAMVARRAHRGPRGRAHRAGGASGAAATSCSPVSAPSLRRP